MKSVQIGVWVLLACGIIPSRSQTPKIDSLKQVLSAETSHASYSTLWGMAYELFDVDNVQAVAFAHRAHEVALREGDSLKIVMSGRIEGQLLRRVDKVKESMKILEEMLPIAERHGYRKEVKMILNALGLSRTFVADYDKALGYHFRSLILRKNDKDSREISTTENNIGVVYLYLENFQQALDHFMASLGAKHQISDSSDLGSLFANIGLCMNGLGKNAEALYYFQQARKTNESKPSAETIWNIETGLGRIYFELGKFELANKHLRKALDAANAEGCQRCSFDNLVALGDLSIKMDRSNDADRYLAKANELPGKLLYKRTLLSWYRVKSLLETRRKNFDQAYRYLSLHSALRDTILNAELRREMLRVQMRHEERENLARIESQAKVLALQQVSMGQQRLLNLTFGAVSLLTVGLAGVLFRMNRSKLRINRKLDLRVKERTRELENSYELLKHTHEEVNHIISRLSGELRAEVATFKGLSFVASRDLPSDKIAYFVHAEATAEKMLDLLYRLAPRK